MTEYRSWEKNKKTFKESSVKILKSDEGKTLIVISIIIGMLLANVIMSLLD